MDQPKFTTAFALVHSVDPDDQDRRVRPEIMMRSIEVIEGPTASLEIDDE